VAATHVAQWSARLLFGGRQMAGLFPKYQIKF